MNPFVVFIAVAICIARFAIAPTHVSIGGSYQAAAHLFVGGLVGAWLANKDEDDTWWRFVWRSLFGSRKGYGWLYLAVAMSFVEIIAAIVTRTI